MYVKGVVNKRAKVTGVIKTKETVSKNKLKGRCTNEGIKKWKEKVDCEQSLRMVARARKARERKSSKASESRGEAGEKAGKEEGTAFSFEPDVFK